MRLPNAQAARVEERKIKEYLLNPEHPDNGGKAAFFLVLGFSCDHWRAFAEALRRLAATTEVTERVDSRHGHKYVIDGQLDAPGGQVSTIRRIWIVDRGLDRPRLVTAYPQEAATCT